MEVEMSRTVRILLMSALMLLGAGLLLYHYGSELTSKCSYRIRRFGNNRWATGGSTLVG